MCVCVRARACVRACVRVCVCVCVSARARVLQMDGQSWVWALMLAYFLFLGPFFVVGTFLNFVAVAYNSSAGERIAGKGEGEGGGRGRRERDGTVSAVRLSTSARALGACRSAAVRRRVGFTCSE